MVPTAYKVGGRKEGQVQM